MPDSNEPLHIYVPNTFQKPNVFVDKLLRLLSGNEAKLLDAASREIMGWDKSRASRRSRISLTRFEELTGMSRQAVVDNLKALIEANILILVGEWNSLGQMYEINIGQKGDYDFFYLEHRGHRGGNPNPTAAREALAAKSAQRDPNLPATSGGAGGLLNRPPEEAENDAGLSQKTGSGLLNRPEAVYSIDSTNTKQKSNEINSLTDESPLAGEGGLAEIWRAVLAEIAPGFANFDDWFVDTCLTLGEDGAYVIRAPAARVRDWLSNRMGARLRRALSSAGAEERPLRFEVGDCKGH